MKAKNWEELAKKANDERYSLSEQVEVLQYENEKLKEEVKIKRGRIFNDSSTGNCERKLLQEQLENEKLKENLVEAVEALEFYGKDKGLKARTVLAKIQPERGRG